MKILFLDIDGVLVPHSSLESRRTAGIKNHTIENQQAVLNLNYVLHKTGAEIVLSSAWRFSGLVEMCAIFEEWGIIKKPVDMTPDLSLKSINGFLSVPRHKEIQEWITSYSKELQILKKYKPKYKNINFVILDDLKDMGPFKNRHVCTDPNFCLTIGDANKAVDILEKG